MRSCFKKDRDCTLKVSQSLDSLNKRYLEHFGWDIGLSCFKKDHDFEAKKGQRLPGTFQLKNMVKEKYVLVHRFGLILVMVQ
jgi:hypothetical protein